MKALVFAAPRQLELREVPEPAASPEQVIVRVEATGICGSDVAGFLGRSSRRQPPLILGHEVVGTVVSTPRDTREPTARRVVVNPLQTCGACRACLSGADNQCQDWRLLGMDRVPGGFAEYVAVDARNIMPIPDDMPVEAAALVEPMANTVHVLRLLGPEPLGRLLILGAGTQGMLALLLALQRGVLHVAISETDPARRQLARELGAEECWNPDDGEVVLALRQWAPEGVDAVVEAVGVEDTRRTAIEAVRSGGKVVLLGLHHGVTSLDFSRVVRKEVTLQGSFAYTRQDFAESLRILASGALELRRFVETAPLDLGQDAFARACQGLGRVLKLLLVP